MFHRKLETETQSTPSPIGSGKSNWDLFSFLFSVLKTIINKNNSQHLHSPHTYDSEPIWCTPQNSWLFGNCYYGNGSLKNAKYSENENINPKIIIFNGL